MFSLKEELSLARVLEIILKLWWLVLIFAVAVAFIAFSVSKFFMTPKYTSKAKVYVDGSQHSTGGVNYNDLTTNARLVSTYIEILCSDSALDRVAADCGYDNVTGDKIKSNITMNSANETEVLEINYNDITPEKSRDILQTLLYNAQDEVSKVISGCKVMIVDNASLPTTTSSPNVKQNTFIGLFLGVVLGVAVVFIKELIDTRVKDYDDLKTRYNIAVLGIIPNLDSE